LKSRTVPLGRREIRCSRTTDFPDLVNLIWSFEAEHARRANVEVLGDGAGIYRDAETGGAAEDCGVQGSGLLRDGQLLHFTQVLGSSK